MLLKASSFLTILARHEMVYRKCTSSVCKKYNLSPTSFDIVMFLGNNPKLNTARDICNLRGMKAGIVSVSVEQLIGRKLLERRPDPEDRRLQRLFLTEEAQNLLTDGRDAQQRYEDALASGLTEEEQAEFIRLFRKLWAHWGNMANCDF